MSRTDALTPEPARADDLEAVLRLVRDAGLPTAGIDDAFPLGYCVVRQREPQGARQGNPVIAVAGLERHGDAGLLRSLAVAPAFRGAGIARRLVEDRARAARAQGLRAVYLLTTTAADYFRRLGFRDTPRAEAPSALQRSSEFASICPASAACLSLSLSHQPQPSA